ncbi:MAG: hypothetical protein HONDAALG_02940 [Gammaproteobacteria bacterium]|jgi:hypothetical protein|nr:hypothetical protein [Gammaproteobacteria bacterium]
MVTKIRVAAALALLSLTVLFVLVVLLSVGVIR